ncbi:MAG TPA: protein adenylyltransferase SelO family protein, partial [Polyangiales bacterium]|nr:protein adenylyltransferase SelO family protein [Polyangiales bacterium]
MPTDAPLFPFDNSYARLPEHFYARVAPTPGAEPRLVRVNDRLARQLGLDPSRLAGREAVEVFAGNRVPEGAEPIAMAYAGFQFGAWVPQLGHRRHGRLPRRRHHRGPHYTGQRHGGAQRHARPRRREPRDGRDGHH